MKRIINGRMWNEDFMNSVTSRAFDVKDNCDLRKGQFLLKRHQGYSDGVFILLSDEEARAWFELHCPDETDRYEEVFGPATNPWTGSGTVKLVEQAESRLNSMKWDKERAEDRAKKAETELEALKAKLESLTKAPEVSGEV